MKTKIFLIFILFFLKTYGMHDKPIISFNHSSGRTQNNSHLSLSDRTYINHELMRNKINSINVNTLYQKNELANIKSNYIASFNSVAGASKILNLETLKPFISNFASNPAACFDVQNQQIIDRLIPVLFNKLGYPKQELTSFEKYQVARVVTDYLHTNNPSEYISTIKEYINQGHSEFIQVLKEETSLGSWIKLQICTKPYGLLQGLFDTTSFHGTASEFANLVSNEFPKHLALVNSLVSQGKFAEAKAIIDKYAQDQSDYGVKQHQALNKLYDHHLNVYCNRVCQMLELKKPAPAVLEAIKQLPLCKTPQEVAQLVYETLARNQDDFMVIQDMQKLLNDHGLPGCYNYDAQIVKDIALSPYLTEDQIQDHVLLFNVALTGAKNEQEKITLPVVAHYLEKACSNNALSECYSNLAHSTYDALKNPQSNEAVILKCGDFTQTVATPEHETLQRRTVPLVANLINEIKRLESSAESKPDVTRFKSELQKLDKLFQKAQFCPKAQAKLAVIIARLNSELKTFSRFELFLSPSMDELRKALGLDLVASTRYGSVNSEEISRFSNLTPEQQVAHTEVLKDYKDIPLNAAFYKGTEHTESYRIRAQLLEAVHQLNEDFNTTLAQEGLPFVQDIFDVATDHRLPREILDRAGDTLLHPLDYCSRTLEGIKNITVALTNEAYHFRLLNLATPEEQYAYARSRNESLHEFFDTWKQLPAETKREFVAQLVVDTALNKAVGSIPKLLTNSAAFSEFSGSLGSRLASIISDVPPTLQGSGVLAVPVAEALGAFGEAVQNVGAVVVEGVASTPAAIGFAAQSSYDSVLDFRSGDGNDNSAIINSKWGKIIAKYPINAPIKNEKDILYIIETTLNNSIKEQINITRKQFEHIFSENHIKNGIMQLGDSEEIIFKKFIDCLLQAESRRLLGENGNQIEAMVDNLLVTVRAHIINGKVTSFDGFVGTSDRVIGRLIKL